jgi:hypothetical protein
VFRFASCESEFPCASRSRRDPRIRASCTASKWRNGNLWLCPRSGFCGRMPPKRGPLWRGEGAKEKSAGGRTRCAPVRCMYTDVHPANPVAPSRSRKAGCLETATPGVCSLVTFLCTRTAPQERREQRSWRQRREGQDARSQESNPLARRASGSFAPRIKIKVDSSFRGNDVTAEELDYSPLPRLALRAIRCANVRFGILPPQSGLRRNDGQRGPS